MVAGGGNRDQTMVEQAAPAETPVVTEIVSDPEILSVWPAFG